MMMMLMVHLSKADAPRKQHPEHHHWHLQQQQQGTSEQQVQQETWLSVSPCEYDGADGAPGIAAVATD